MVKNSTLPNKLSVSRILMIPLLIVLLVRDEPLMSLGAFFLFLLAGLTDLVDGYLARKYNSISNLGKFLDPLADKLVIFAALVMLLNLGRIHFLFVLILVGRDVAVNALRGAASSSGFVMAAQPIGKWKTASQFIALSLIILGPDNLLFNFSLYGLGHICLWLAAILSVYSGIHYFRQFMSSISKPEAKTGESIGHG